MISKTVNFPGKRAAVRHILPVTERQNNDDVNVSGNDYARRPGSLVTALADVPVSE